MKQSQKRQAERDAVEAQEMAAQAELDGVTLN